MLELIQATAAYSNAVLLAIWPQVAQFIVKSELPMPVPVTMHQVREFRCFPVKDRPGGLIILTNQLRIWYRDGHVQGFRTPRSYYNLQDPADIPRFFGTLNLTRDDALDFARKYLVKLGYTLEETFADQEPAVELPPRIGTNLVPYYRFQWKDPVFGQTAVSIELDAGRRMVAEIQISSPFFSRLPPKVSVQPTLRTPKLALNAGASNEFLSVTLPKISAFARKLELPVKLPVSSHEVERVAVLDGDADVRIKLTNGYWFVSRRGVITEFNAPDSVFGRQPPTLDASIRPLEDYLGEWKLSEKNAAEMVRRAIERLGYKVQEFKADRDPHRITRDPVGQYTVPRYGFYWLTNNPATGETIAMVRAEVDADQGSLKHIELLSERLARESKTNVTFFQNLGTRMNRPARPPMFKTNTLEFKTNLSQELIEHDEIIEFLNRVMPFATNSIPTAPPSTKPFNPYE